MSNEFEVAGSGGGGAKVDWKALNQHVVDVAQCQQPETLIGIISVIVNMGVHEQEPAAYESKLTPKQEQEALDAWVSPFEGAERFWFEDVTFEDKGIKTVKRCKRWKVYTQEAAFGVDFPDIIVDKGQFFGDSSPLPLRLWMGGESFYKDGTPMHSNGVKLSFNREMGSTSRTKTLHSKSYARIMAVAAKVTAPDELITPQTVGGVLGNLLGKSMQFSVQVSMEKGMYYTEKISNPTALGRGQSTPECPTTPYMIGFESNNSEEAIEHLPSKVVNRMRMNKDFEGSKVQGQLAAIKGGDSSVSLYKASKHGGTNTPPAGVAENSPENSPKDSVAEYQESQSNAVDSQVVGFDIPF